MWLLNCPGRRMINIRLKECDFVTVPVTGVVMDGFPKSNLVKCQEENKKDFLEEG